MKSPYQDDLNAIPNNAQLIRRINSRFCDWETLDRNDNPRITSQAVQFYTPKMAKQVGCPAPALSVIVEHLAAPIHVLATRYQTYGLARCEAQLIRGTGALGIQLWPTPGEPAHAVIFRIDGGNRLFDSIRHKLTEHFSDNWIKPPPYPTN